MMSWIQEPKSYDPRKQHKSENEVASVKHLLMLKYTLKEHESMLSLERLL
jgi:hypothetical protein